ncbi:uncharacterized protein Z520_00132 [Fonsecaea multimorphosa CBS 102226]|uniref:Peptidase A1 domain-containing protein n=1 Tax=Fonsecaea multimorphosa CBS 102226 TaxID=1442371 RepID=A0A0D2HNR1_9EURO|nr:uncharacterized protein Z520_00132 [Fonsecaea multimorphosa CBS 102226]KIY03441.1 hypothetical protein Z520_00132 [Fonsecaea multimorphosa CBS 102226]OAL32847.1 hypothetical protein AYO22_00173 [Fonsecaea multimorphosa]
MRHLAAFCLLFPLLLLTELVTGAPSSSLQEYNRRSSKSILLKTRRVNKPTLRRRQDDGDSFLTTIAWDPTESQYEISVGIGTPLQDILLVVDTGSSDTWAFPPDLCSITPNCFWSFDPDQSSTYEVVGSGAFSITYEEGTSVASGDFFKDTASFEGGVQVEDVQFGLATAITGNLSYGVAGLGFDTNEAEPGYPDLIDMLVSSGTIDTPLFSLWSDLIGPDSGGYILFGGVDETAYKGDIVWRPMVADDDGVYREYAITLTGWGTTADPPKQLVPVDVKLDMLLDSGTTNIVVPQDMYNAIVGYLPFAVNNGNVDCTGIPAGSVDFYFGDELKISIPFQALVLPLSPGSDSCFFGIEVASEGGWLILGDTFLQNAYVAFDLANYRFGIAPTNYGPTDSS